MYSCMCLHKSLFLMFAGKILDRVRTLICNSVHFFGSMRKSGLTDEKGSCNWKNHVQALIRLFF